MDYYRSISYYYLILGVYIIYSKPCNDRRKRANELQDENYIYKDINNNE